MSAQCTSVPLHLEKNIVASQISAYIQTKRNLVIRRKREELTREDIYHFEYQKILKPQKVTHKIDFASTISVVRLRIIPFV